MTETGEREFPLYGSGPGGARDGAAAGRCQTYDTMPFGESKSTSRLRGLERAQVFLEALLFSTAIFDRDYCRRLLTLDDDARQGMAMFELRREKNVG